MGNLKVPQLSQYFNIQQRSDKQITFSTGKWFIQWIQWPEFQTITSSRFLLCSSFSSAEGPLVGPDR